ncbi:hypothetical protein UA08_01877 [Talaromyces atroroseus]|uniref:RNA helicase n=1 Tax=Talaromyces atroroseus TaxID=1441469 RepID=A0A1Q5QA47_TALAT|nr:hypothetical protein UA08_01877 [Talaromyces atroroseus]OKL62814.1 hypothetical protein UA08_01877 [Talaromyces atroroseus]
MAAVLMPNGNVVFLDKYAYSAEYNLTTNTARGLTCKTNAFCSGGSFLADGRVISVGGNGPLLHIDPTVGDGFRAIRYLEREIDDSDGDDDDDGWYESGHRLSTPRWYPSVQIMPDKRLFVASGSVNGLDPTKEENNNPTFEILDQNGRSISHSIRLSILERNQPYYMYPFLHLLKDSRLFIFVSRSAEIYDVTNQKTTRRLPNLRGAHRTYPNSGGSVLLPLKMDNNWEPDIIVCGGGAYADITSLADRTCGHIQPLSADPVWQIEKMPEERWTQVDDCWFLLDPSLIPFSCTLLLDGTVMVAGSNPIEQPRLEPDFRSPATTYVTEFRVEIYTPPYLNEDNAFKRPRDIWISQKHISADGTSFVTAFTGFEVYPWRIRAASCLLGLMLFTSCSMEYPEWDSLLCVTEKEKGEARSGTQALTGCTLLAMNPFATKDMADALPEVMPPVSRLDQEAATLARDKGWVEPEKYDYTRYAGQTTETPANGHNVPVNTIPWASDARKYEWKEEYGDVGPKDEELEKMLFRSEFINRAGVKFENISSIKVVVEATTKVAPIASFKDAGLHPVMLENIALCGYKIPTPIQAYGIPTILEGRDLMAVAQTGSGKTAAFLIPILSKLMGKAKKLTAPRPNVGASFDPKENAVRAEPLVLVIVPTRELACQIFDEARRLCYRSMLRPCVAYGGGPISHQRTELQQGCDILIGTPGRLIDFMSKPHILSLRRVRYTIIDEADELLQADWEEDFTKLLSGGDANEDGDHCYMMFSATFNKGCREVARKHLENDHVRIRVGRAGSTHVNIQQKIVYADEDAKKRCLYDRLLSMPPARTLVFVNSKAQADLIDDYLYNMGLPSTSIHSGRTQREREDAMIAFRSGKTPILIATGVSARGLDVKNVMHVINYDLPNVDHGGIDEYIHRIGRTARIGNEGFATSFYNNEKNTEIARDLVMVLMETDQDIPDFLQELKPEGKPVFDDDTDGEAETKETTPIEEPEISSFSETVLSNETDGTAGVLACEGSCLQCKLSVIKNILPTEPCSTSVIQQYLWSINYYSFVAFTIAIMAPITVLVYFILLIGVSQTIAMIPQRMGPYEFVIDTFCESPFNELGAWHGPGENLPIKYDEDDDGDCLMRLFPSNPDHNYHTQFSYSCFDLTDHEDMYLHVEYSGSDAFTISIFQHNGECNSYRAPYPGTSDSVEAARYTTSDNNNNIYVPISHFYVDLDIVSSIGFHGFYTTDETILRKVEIVKYLPDDVEIPRKLPTGTLVLNCKRPNSFAFGIDDGDPRLAQEVMEILDDEDITVTFFVVGMGLLDPSTNFTDVYTEMLRRGHQVALHSSTHPKMEGLHTRDEIDDEILGGYYAIKELLGVESRYFRPPYGTVGARTRQRLSTLLDDPYIVNWSVDVEDWLWAGTDRPERQLRAFRRDVDRGGDLVVMHYLTWDTVQYFRDFIQIARDTGKQIMRVDQCMMDPDAPELISVLGENGKLLRTQLQSQSVLDSQVGRITRHTDKTMPPNDSDHNTTAAPNQQPASSTMSTPAHQDPSTYPRKVHLDDEKIYLELTYTPLDTNSILSHVSSPSAGANVLFLGTTRDSFNNRAVSQLSYTSYATLALKTLTEIAREAKRAFAIDSGNGNSGLIAISIAHRLGVVPISEASIAIAVSAGHRGTAWRAAESLLESCKEKLEVWKREEFVGERPEDGEWRANRDTDPEGRFVEK